MVHECPLGLCLVPPLCKQLLNQEPSFHDLQFVPGLSNGDGVQMLNHLAGFGHTLDLFLSFWSRDLVQKLRAEILRILVAVARPELNYEAHFWPKRYSD